MSHTKSISLGDHQAAFVDRQVAAGRFSSASDVVRVASELLEEQEGKLDRLRTALSEGEASGAGEPFDIASFLAEKRSSQP
ncbi:type II toxin-antitoxin system ParD family antitoxin [Xanthobacter autotrophicus]|uniref:type II toxin-antitoxin system ParD family antitoxin n=2 Tax=Xanthobacter TaxID=279 RepID=UPI0024AB3521|nr:type II toxin-antitoxin system ParD family antitoxin [Xanthobacter autotrophicus]MDI4662920.1 type II toxin-antitoxin system ParD family antitoxin [Xanthobacter autotrophicus]